MLYKVRKWVRPESKFAIRAFSGGIEISGKTLVLRWAQKSDSGEAPGNDPIDLGLSGALGVAFALFRLANFIRFFTTVARAIVCLNAGFFPGIIGYVPATALKVKTVQRHKLLQLAFTVGATA